MIYLVPQPSILEDGRVSAFVEVAQRYCILIESHEEMSRQDFVKACAVALAQLFGTAVALADVSVEVTEGRVLDGMSHNEWRAIFDSLGRKLGELDSYWLVFDPYAVEAPITTLLSDDLSGVYRDLQDGFCVYGRTESDSHEAVRHWSFSFLIHWGRHCSNALRASYSLLLMQFEAED